MKIALYNDHHNLPFWHTPCQPSSLFDEKLMADYPAVFLGLKSEEKLASFSESMDWNILIGLAHLNIPNIMAHVSYDIDNELKNYKRTKRFWVQITTEPTEVDEKDLPLVVKNGKANVIHLWGGDNGTYHPTQLIKNAFSHSDVWDSKFWTYFFQKEINEEKGRLANEILKKETGLVELKKLISLYPEYPTVII